MFGGYVVIRQLTCVVKEKTFPFCFSDSAVPAWRKHHCNKAAGPSLQRSDAQGPLHLDSSLERQRKNAINYV